MQTIRTALRGLLGGSFAVLLLGTGCQSKVTEPGVKIDPPPAEHPAATVPSPAIRGTRWLLAQVGGRSLVADTAAARAPYLQLLTTQPRAEGDAGCNRFSGEFTLAPEAHQLRFGPVMATKMACDQLVTETAFLRALEATKTYRIRLDSLYLLDSLGTTPLATFHAAR